MQLIKLVSMEGHVFEEMLATCKHFGAIWRQVEARNRRNRKDDTAIRVQLSSAHLEQLMSWGRRHTHDEVNTNVNTKLILEYLTKDERVFLLGRPEQEFKDFGLLGLAVECPRLMSMVAALNVERSRDMRIDGGNGGGMWRQQAEAVRQRMIDERAELLHRRRLFASRSHY